MEDKTFKFKCTDCGHTFQAPSTLYATTTLPTPQLCPRCGGMRTRPRSFIFCKMYDAIYKGIWNSMQRQKQEKE